MTQPSKKKRGQVSGEGSSNPTLDTLLALDRMVVDFSMRAYNVPQRDRLILREQNRRLHDAVRMHLGRS